MSFRVTPEFKAKLDEWSERSGRSIAAEIELRLTQSDRDEKQLDQGLELMCGSTQFAGLLKLLAVVAGEVGPQAAFGAAVKLDRPFTAETAQGWADDAFAYDQVVRSVILALECLRPSGPRVPQRLLEPVRGGPVDTNTLLRELGTGYMNGWLAAIVDPENAPTGKQQREGAAIRQLFGNAVDRVAANLELLRCEAKNGSTDG
jgi:hypothetical protein